MPETKTTTAAPADPLRQVLSRFPEIRLAVVFGSAAAGRAGPASDLDLAVLASGALPRDRVVELIGALAEATGRPIDLVDLARAGEPLLGEILRGGRRVLERDPDAWAEVIRRHLAETTDFLPYRRRILEERRRAWLNR